MDFFNRRGLCVDRPYGTVDAPMAGPLLLIGVMNRSDQNLESTHRENAARAGTLIILQGNPKNGIGDSPMDGNLEKGGA